MRESVTRLDCPRGSLCDTVCYVACTVRYLGLHDLADTIIAGDLEGGLLRCRALGLGFQADRLAALLDR